MNALSERQRLILKEIVDRYIRQREPVSSRMILEDYGLGVSSATVRNEMNDLEAAGYIQKPYSSSGRIPTKTGYRFFVDWLLDLSELTKEERMEIVETYETRCLDVEETIRQTAFLLSNMTGCAAFVVPPRPDEMRLDRVALLQMSPKLAYLVIVSDIGVVEHGLVPLEDTLPPGDIERITELINNNLRGVNLSEVRQLADDDTEGWYERPVREALVVLGRLLQRRLQSSVQYEGLFHLADALQTVPGEAAMEHFTALGHAVRDESAFAAAVAEARSNHEGIVVSIGDFPLSGVQEFSVVSCGFRPHAGMLGVIGPLWMDYGRTLSAVRYIASRLETLLLGSCTQAF
ncbi:heat-inducible transcriptional repressor HrcA [Candidatus Bipolaricaulota bacterium]